MIRLEKTKITGYEAAIRGMRNPKNSWEKSDSIFFRDNGECQIGPNDIKLMSILAKAGSDHAKFRRMIVVTVDILAPLYWWKEADQYRIGVTTNSCSTMHKIAAKEFELDDFSHEHLLDTGMWLLDITIDRLNKWRTVYVLGNQVYEPKNKEIWWQMIQLLPSSYNQKRTVMLNYEVLSNIYHARKNHKLDEWVTFCDWIKELPLADRIIIGGNDEVHIGTISDTTVFDGSDNASN